MSTFKFAVIAAAKQKKINEAFQMITAYIFEQKGVNLRGNYRMDTPQAVEAFEKMATIAGAYFIGKHKDELTDKHFDAEFPDPFAGMRPQRFVFQQGDTTDTTSFG